MLRPSGCLILCVFPVDALLRGLDASSTRNSCVVPADASKNDLLRLQQLNCGKVLRASIELPDLIASESQDMKASWQKRIALAKEACATAKDTSNLTAAAYIAVQAWSTDLMDGRECCSNLAAPYCFSLDWSQLEHSAPFLIALIATCMMMLSPLCCRQLTAPPLMRCSRTALVSQRREQATSAVRRPTGSLDARAGRTLEEDLASSWKASPLSTLPGSVDWCKTAVDLFASLQRYYDFQVDSVRNQFEHFLSLWRSHVAMVADRSLTDGDSVDEADLLPSALGEMHEELLEGFLRWRQKFSEFSQADILLASSGDPARPLGVAWPVWEAKPEVHDLAPKLADLAVFLLVWGEAGNLRFMPEMLYFITELALAAKLPTADDDNNVLYECCADEVEGMCSGLFLSCVVRPIYNVVFDESYDRIGIDVPGMEIRWTAADRERLLSVAIVSPRRSGQDLRPELRLEHRHTGRRRSAISSTTSQKWLFQPVGFGAAGVRLYRICWAADPKYCINVAKPTGRSRNKEPRLSIVEASDSDVTQQLFILDEAQGCIEWATVGDDGVHWCISAAGNPATTMRLQLCPVDTRLDDRQRFQFEVKTKGKDAKKLHEGFDSFLPPDTANYDDWNELFSSPERLTRSLLLRGTSDDKLFDLNHHQRFAALGRVDWQASLAGAKTHRELHSWWGAFASTHRIWLLHTLAFALLVCAATTQDLQSESPEGGEPITGRTREMCYATVCLIIPVHAMCWKFACWATSGGATRRELYRCSPQLFASACSAILWAAPVATYAALRLSLFGSSSVLQFGLFVVHFAISTLGALHLLLWPALLWKEDWGPLTSVPCCTTAARWVFWTACFAAKCAFGYLMIRELNTADADLVLCNFLHSTLQQYKDQAFTPLWDRDALEWGALWAAGFLFFLADTQLWFVSGCTVFGIIVALAQRGWHLCRFIAEDAVACIPQRFSEKVLPYETAAGSVSLECGGREAVRVEFSARFPALWDRIVDYMRYEDKLNEGLLSQLSFYLQPRRVNWSRLQLPLSAPGAAHPRYPDLFRPRCYLENALKRGIGIISDASWPRNAELQWRLAALARSLSLALPYPCRAPYIPGLTVLIPHYGEDILMTKEQLIGQLEEDNDAIAPLMSWLEGRYPDEFAAFTERKQESMSIGSRWTTYQAEHWEKLCVWASMRNQTLWRTVAGMSLYHSALDCHYRIQGDKLCSMSKAWDPSSCFTCVVSMQMYKYFNPTQLAHTNQMLEKFPNSLKIAFIDSEDKGPGGDSDNVHVAQQRRYFSCLLDRDSQRDPASGRRSPHYRIELPGFPILGDGKGDNQNHAVPFTRGTFIQCIDANQGAYFEQMMLLPCVLGEFRDNAKKIVGFPEHITSDIGSIGDFAASAEFAFGTVLQRSYAALGARMHYGHPDIMNKTYMMQQGGVSKATKTLHLSEDIFAGMDFTLRGAGRSIVHREYFHVTKGRDMGFSTVLAFFSKLSAGSGEVVLTRQSFRLGQRLPLPEFLTFYYAHVGYYLTQYFVSRVPPFLLCLWLMVVCNDPEDKFSAMGSSVGLPNPPPKNPVVMASLLSKCFSWIAVLFMVAQAAPFVVEVWMQQGLLMALKRYINQLLTLSPLHFVFQSKVIGIYVANELRNGGANYIATGRGLPTQRVGFLQLYKTFAQIAFYDGARMLASSLLVILAGAVTSGLMWWWLVLGLTIVSWLFAPFLFNPYQYARRYFCKDLASLREFFISEGGGPWSAWYEKTQLLKGTGLRVTIFDILYWAFLVSAWYTTVGSKTHIYTTIFPNTVWRVLPVLPPVFLSLLLTGIGACIEPCAGTRYGPDFRAAPLLHLAPAAAICVFADLVETFGCLAFLISAGWWKSFVAGLLLKYCLLSLLLSGAECLLRLGWCPAGFIQAHVRLWLYGHRMAMDILVSALLFCSLSPLVLFDAIRDSLSLKCSLHNILIFRNAGQIRATPEVNILQRSGSDTLGISGDAAGGNKDPLLECEAGASTTGTEPTVAQASGPAPAWAHVVTGPPARPVQGFKPVQSTRPHSHEGQSLSLPTVPPPDRSPQVPAMQCKAAGEYANTLDDAAYVRTKLLAKHSVCGSTSIDEMVEDILALSNGRPSEEFINKQINEYLSFGLITPTSDPSS